jgi:1-deoxy-D-xylulose-5-phosphate synthase
MTLLESINSPADLRALPPDQLRTVADEIRSYILETMSRVGGHTGASLGAVELAVALHYAFDTPRDRLVWDVGHQAYAHKILTGRRDLTNRNTTRSARDTLPRLCPLRSEWLSRAIAKAKIITSSR